MVSHATWLPPVSELKVKQEITLSTPAMKAAGPYMHLFCEPKCKEYMLCRKEEKDPRKCLREGADVTACGVQFLQAVKNKCRQQFDDYANCIDYRSDSKMFVANCKAQRRPWDECVLNNFNLQTPELGQFAKPHVHHTDRPKPAVNPLAGRDYEAEARQVMAELPDDKNMPKHYGEYATTHTWDGLGF